MLTVVVTVVIAIAIVYDRRRRSRRLLLSSLVVPHCYPLVVVLVKVAKHRKCSRLDIWKLGGLKEKDALFADQAIPATQST